MQLRLHIPRYNPNHCCESGDQCTEFRYERSRTCRRNERLHAAAHLHLQQQRLVVRAGEAGVLQQQQRPASVAQAAGQVAAGQLAAKPGGHHRKAGTSMQSDQRRVRGSYAHSSEAPLPSLVQPPQRAHSLDGRAAVTQGRRMVGSHLSNTRVAAAGTAGRPAHNFSAQHRCGQCTLQMTRHRRQIHATQSAGQQSAPGPPPVARPPGAARF